MAVYHGKLLDGVYSSHKVSFINSVPTFTGFFVFVCFFLSFLHSALLQDDAAEANHPPGHGVSCEWACDCKWIKIHLWAADKYSLLLVLSSGQWIFQFPDVDFGEWSNRLGFEVYRGWGAVWTGVFSGFFQPAVCIFLFIHMILSCFPCLRLTSMSWSQVAQTSSSPMKTRKNTSSKELKVRFHHL